MRCCSVCNLEKPLLDFPESGKKNDKMYYRSLCKSCYSLKQIPISKEYRDINKERVNQYHRKNKMKTRYGITVEEYDRLFLKQEGKCKICGTTDTSPNKNFAVDHCHTTKVIRGLLCGACNKALGLMQDDVTRLTSAIQYLGETQKKKK